MDTPVAACIIAACLLAGGITGAADKLGDSMYYDGFLEDPHNYHLVDSAGNPVSQEVE